MSPRTAALALILLVVLSLLSRGLQERLRNFLIRRQAAVFLAPLVLTLLFAGLAAWVGAFTWRLVLLAAAYLLIPTAIAFFQGAGPVNAPSALDFAIIGILWLPMEFAVARTLVPRPAQGFLHTAAYGVAILLALILFVCFRGWQGLKYRLPESRRDFLYAAAGFAASAPVLILIGRWIGFIPPFHLPAHPEPAWMAAHFLVILAATALPEEILFRSLIQNGLMRRYGANTAVLLVASLIFGCAHLNNGAQNGLNWRYMILATIAGVAYGRVFQKSSSIWGSAALHALVDWTKHIFF
ncbi:MAG TPA: type II CAAX endopeptidase family protein [Bryobacteraceae bacterium]|jgi:membrane protease YdiL (CAAX protease family)|nr:type II CAAX endopeptidase family protein [Bryobacteraceae bacterium]